MAERTNQKVNAARWKHCQTKAGNPFNGISRTSFWRLKTGRIKNYNPDYHSKKINCNYQNLQFDLNDCYRIAGKAVSEILSTDNYYFDDIVSEAVYRFLIQTGKGKDNGKASFLYQISKYTVLDYMKKKFFKEHSTFQSLESV